MIVPWDALSPGALSGLIEEYVTRDGTELTDAEEKAAQVRRALERGELLLVYDAATESCNILPADEAPDASPQPELERDDAIARADLAMRV